MQTVDRIEALRMLLKPWRRADLKIAFVPTMGNLHAGHLRLVEVARRHADKVVVSIFVNPTQFGPTEDFASYPRTEADDAAKLSEAGADLLFLPGVAEIYPRASLTTISVAGLSTIHCGASRPGHFDGVALVVCKLLNMVQPDLLLLGEKDFQQLALIRRMVADLNLPVKIQGVATARDDDGLALSSRNGYLTAPQRASAPELYRCLRAAGDAIQRGERDFAGIEAAQSLRLTQAGFVVDYFTICRAADLAPATSGDMDLVILAAAKLGNTRLIDNLVCRSNG